MPLITRGFRIVACLGRLPLDEPENLMLRRQQRNAPAGFTIVELLVVIGIIAILLSLVSISLTQAGQSARQTKALSALKQIGTAWTQYANQSEDRAMPGYMDDGVQAAFKIKARDGSGQRVDPQFCRTYSYRLLPFLDNDRSLMYDYYPDNEMPSELPPQVVADSPAFGYNAFYVGGWWTSETGAPKMRFSGTGYYGTGGQLVQRQEVVVRSLAQIERTSELIIFAASAPAQPGFIKNPDETAIGSAWVVPHKRAMTNIWSSSDGASFETMQRAGASIADTGKDFLAQLFQSDSPNIVQVQGSVGIDVFVAESVPLRRIKNVVTTVRADMSTTAQGLRDLMDQRRWINVAGHCDDPINFGHPEQ